MNNALPLACPQSNTVFYVLVILSFSIGIAVFILLRKDDIKKAGTLAGVTLLLPLILWIIDGYTAMAQTTFDPDYEFGSGCFTEGVFSQLARLNYGIWIMLFVLTIAIVTGIVSRRLTKNK